MKKKVIVAGHICLDITPVFPDGKVKSVEQVLSPGKLIQMGNADVHTGGAVANTGLAMKLLGADVSLMGKVGEDAFGDMILNILDGYDAKEGMIRDKESTTSYSVVLAIPGIDRIFLHHPGANHTFAVSDIDFDKVKEAALFHFGYPTLMESMYNNDGAELVHLMKSVQETGAATSLDLAAVDANSKAGQADWAKILGRTLPYVDFFVPSIEELCFMLDRDKFEELQVRADGGDITDVLDIEQDVKPLAEKCITLGCKVLLLKCGAKGMYLQTAGEEKLRQVSVRTELDVAAWAEKAVFEKSYIPEKILSGTGAGDTSIAAFLTAMLEGNTPEMCLHLAAATGASCVAAYDALSGLKSFEELKKKRKMALRMGTLADANAHYSLNPQKIKELCLGYISVDDLTENDFSISFAQKGVDMRIGLDIASLAYKKQADQIILIAGDSDFVPAAKLARREGVDFILDPMEATIRADLFEHIDGLKSCWKKPKQNKFNE